jgi:hypothetical protein
MATLVYATIILNRRLTFLIFFIVFVFILNLPYYFTEFVNNDVCIINRKVQIILIVF